MLSKLNTVQSRSKVFENEANMGHDVQIIPKLRKINICWMNLIQSDSKPVCFSPQDGVVAGQSWPGSNTAQ